MGEAEAQGLSGRSVLTIFTWKKCECECFQTNAQGFFLFFGLVCVHIFNTVDLCPKFRKPLFMNLLFLMHGFFAVLMDGQNDN